MTAMAYSLSALVDEGLEAIEEAMYQATNSDVDVLQDASRHILGAGGKRMRPRLLLLSYLALGGGDLNYVAKPAAAIELMHTASVVHDDINDHGILRRGRPSINSIWGRTFALLTGDFLFTAVYELMAPYQDLNIDLAAAATALVEGETLQASAVKNKHFSREIYMRVIALKTAALFRAAGAIGAKMANGSHEQVEALSNFGFNVGMAFQIVDDILDLVADQSKLGKSTGIDVQQGRGVAVAMDTQNSENNGSGLHEDPIDQIKHRFLQGDTLDKARHQAEFLAQAAVSHLTVLPDIPTREALTTLAKQAVSREF